MAEQLTLLQCVEIEPHSRLCGGKGTACKTNASSVRCFCDKYYTGFGDMNPHHDNCDIFIPVVYTLAGLVLFTDLITFGVIIWAIKKRTMKTFMEQLKQRKIIAILTVLGFVMAACEVMWISARVAAIHTRAVGDDAFVTINFSIAVACIYVTAPHVLKYYATLTYSNARLMTLNVIGREKARRTKSLFKPILDIVLPVCAILGAFGPCISINNPSRVRTGLYIISIFTSVLLALTLVFIHLLINPMLQDMKLATSMRRLSSADQITLEIATRKLTIFQRVTIFVSLVYIPGMLLWGFIPALAGSITYIYFLGAWFCACISALCIYTLTNVAKQQVTVTSSSQPNYQQQVQIQIVDMDPADIPMDSPDTSQI